MNFINANKIKGIIMDTIHISYQAKGDFCLKTFHSVQNLVKNAIDRTI